MKALVLGANGQDGQYLGRLLTHQGVDWVGVSRSGKFILGDVGDSDFVSRVVADVRPTHIFHFAANSVTDHGALFENHRAISTGTLNVLEASRKIVPEARIFLSGSALQLRNDGGPINETAPLDLSSAYANARIHSLFSARYFRDRFQMPVYFGYFFNHDSELRSSRHINKRIVETAVRIARGSREKLSIGDPTVRKEFNFAGDIVRAVWTLVNQDAVFEAVLGSGKAHSIQEWADYCFLKLGLDAHDHLTTPTDFRAEYSLLVSDPTVIKSLGWRPEVSFHGLADMVIEQANS